MECRRVGDGRNSAAAASLLTAGAVREGAARLLTLAERDALLHFAYRRERLLDAVDYVLVVMRARYPNLVIPFHSRWRHFAAGGVDRWARLRDEGTLDAAERARVRFDLAITSVLLDAGAGAEWRYREQGGAEYRRSEGLAVASFHMFRSGAFSSMAHAPLRADTAGLAALTPARLAEGLQVSNVNPIAGLEGRLHLLHRLSAALEATPLLFGSRARFGNLYDHLRSLADAAGTLSASRILDSILRGLGSIWPGRYVLDGVPLGDTWIHRALSTGDHTSGYMPFHKLSQWLTYSLIEPLEEAGMRITEVDGLTGLAEYRNGGLMIDIGLLEPRDPRLLATSLRVSDEAVVEWRALTVALLDRIADGIRSKLSLSAAQLPLARVLEGGTWAAGRRVAQERRAGGAPPLSVESDGTVF